MPIWSEDVVTELKSLAEQGFSASQAAANFPGMTRNSAVGLAFRRHFHFNGGRGGGPHHMAADGKPASKRTFTPKRSYRQAPEVVIALSEPVTEAEVGPRRKVSIMELTESTCRWPIGDTHDADFGYCGAKPHSGYQYCASHCRLAYESPQERDRAREESRGSGFYRRIDHQVRNGRTY